MRKRRTQARTITPCSDRATFATLDERWVDEQICALFPNLIAAGELGTIQEREDLAKRMIEIAAHIRNPGEPRELVAWMKNHHWRRPAPHIVAKIMRWSPTTPL